MVFFFSKEFERFSGISRVPCVKKYKRVLQTFDVLTLKVVERILKVFFFQEFETILESIGVSFIKKSLKESL